jgi:hypothetical protein
MFSLVDDFAEKKRKKKKKKSLSIQHYAMILSGIHTFRKDSDGFAFLRVVLRSATLLWNCCHISWTIAACHAEASLQPGTADACAGIRAIFT